ncbi:penicillin-binding transpeptidase domain-containing protein [Arthrobacter cryoconiti]|uniref:Beta-lactamase n=1 Tax=Arthrobacter cryoconiti TaxID=748907 RepID=A0ABV8QZP0_9MICC|nr:penicillin-binding transpeptidase domain-containing protein [Arthrobacter cryoconiti]MCC9068216.1 penicillin-binding protein [Arthrobacter cryoconiti]
MIRRFTSLLLGLALVGGGMSACAPAKDDGTTTAKALAQALTKHTVGELPFDQPGATIQKELDALAKGVDPVWPAVSVENVVVNKDGSAKVALDYSWKLPKTTTAWAYKTEASMQRDGDGWKIAWAPAMIEPSLKAGERLKIDSLYTQRAGILDASGDAIVKDRPVRIVGINKNGLSEADAEAGASALAAVLEIDPTNFIAKVKAYGPVAFVDAITLRDDAFAALDQVRLKSIPGFLATVGTMPLAPSRTFAQAILGTVRDATAEDIEKSKGEVVAGQVVGASGLQAAFDSQLAGTPGITVLAVPGETSSEQSTEKPSTAAPATASPTPAAATDQPPRQLFSVPPVEGKDVKTTLVTAIQNDAEGALAHLSTPSSVVVMRASTGAILASANGPASNGYNTAFLGQYAPGSTFKIATALGLLRQGLTPDSKLSCTPKFTADGKNFLNAPGYAASALGEISMTVAIAHSCNTAFVSQFDKLPQDKLADAAAALGIGMSNDLGLDAFMGSVPRDSAGTEHAASMIGQGKVQASPLALAALMSTVVKGSVSAPVLIDAHDGKAKPASSPALTAPEALALQSMMRASVTDGYLDLLADLPGAPAIGKTGTAEFGTENPPHTHSWVIAAQGDIAVAVFVEDGDLGAVTAGPIAKAMLAAAAGK